MTEPHRLAPETDAAPVPPSAALARLRATGPLVHNITNHVVMQTTANALLAIGASPAMIHSADEVEAFAPIAGALVVNIGTLDSAWLAAMKLAVAAAGQAGVPWVLDPVAAGATPYRTDAAAALARRGPAVIRGNASEILVLAGATAAGGKGVDAAHDAAEAAEAADALAAETGAVVAVTGAIDRVTDGRRRARIAGGDSLMGRITGMGCTASALVGAMLGAGLPPFDAATAALAALGAAGEAAARTAAGPGSLAVGLLDALAALDPAALDRLVEAGSA
jgi:hydroxyethylthiazole kinase